jgi:hypothetical protein
MQSPARAPVPAQWDEGEETLHWDGAHYGGLGITNSAIFTAAARFTPATACTLAAILFYQHDTSTGDYALADSDRQARLWLYDAAGRDVWPVRLWERHGVVTQRLNSGAYFARLRAGSGETCTRVVVP